jgi:UDPglucose 6-dehydrogenase
MLGLGKLGLPVAYTIADKGHEVKGTDYYSIVEQYLSGQEDYPHVEKGLPELMERCSVGWASVSDLTEWSDILFVAVQTPHCKEFDGTHPLPEGREDFDYFHLRDAVRSVVKSISEREGEPLVLAIISTVLPGTIDREIRGLLSGHEDKIQLIYTPQFIAMSTVVDDYRNPEFVLLGWDKTATPALAKMTSFYSTIHDAPVLPMSIESAELCKVYYNTWITTKVNLANNLMELCHYTGANADDITNALCLATDRLISPKYMRPGMGDGGGCHPRDNIAMSWLARKLGMDDIYTKMMTTREAQTQFLADLIKQYGAGRNVIILGASFKANTRLVDGSPALLLSRLLSRMSVKHSMYDPIAPKDSKYSDPPQFSSKPKLYFIGMNHDVFLDYQFEPGSVVLDPWAFVPKSNDYHVIHIGRH